MKNFYKWPPLVLLLSFASLTGCATKSDERILVDTVPSGAECKIFEDGVNGRPFSTPALLSLDRPSHVDINCVKNGYQIADMADEPRLNPGLVALYSPVVVASGILFPFGIIASVITTDSMADNALENGHLSERMYSHHKGPWVLDLKPLPEGSGNINLPEKVDYDHPQSIR